MMVKALRLNAGPFMGDDWPKEDFPIAVAGHIGEHAPEVRMTWFEGPDLPSDGTTVDPWFNFAIRVIELAEEYDVDFILISLVDEPIDLSFLIAANISAIPIIGTWIKTIPHPDPTCNGTVQTKICFLVEPGINYDAMHVLCSHGGVISAD